MTCPRQHRQLKRKDSIRFLVLLVFSNFFIYTGCRKELAPSCHIRVKIYSKAARPLSNLSGVSGNTPPASDSRLLHGSVFGYRISICTQILRFWLPPGWVWKCCPFNHSCFNFPQKLSIGALSQQFPLRLMLLMNPCSFASS